MEMPTTLSMPTAQMKNLKVDVKKKFYSLLSVEESGIEIN